MWAFLFWRPFYSAILASLRKIRLIFGNVELQNALSFEELHDIGKRNWDNPDIKALFWEVTRLHAHLQRLHQVMRSNGRIQCLSKDAIWNEIKDQPVVKRREDLGKPKTVRGDNDETY
jgi:hypothetical protein